MTVAANGISCHSLVLGKVSAVHPLAGKDGAILLVKLLQYVRHNCKSFLGELKMVLIHSNGCITLDCVDF